MSLSAFASRQHRPQSLPLPARPALLNDASFVLRCVTSSTKRRRYGLSRVSDALALRRVATKLACSAV